MATIQANCPICDSQIKLPSDVEESEIITCSECQNRIVVTNVKNNKAVLEEAPKIEEDWGQ